MQSEEVKDLFGALNKFQAAVRKPGKDAVNPHFKSKYADLESMWDAIREPLTANGLSIVQDVERMDGGIGVVTQINHVSGQWYRSTAVFIPLTKQDAHGAGSAITYGKRYGLGAALGLVASDDDDDGNGAAGKPVDLRAQATKAVEAIEYDMSLASTEQALAGLWTKAVKTIETLKADGFSDLADRLVRTKDARKAALAKPAAPAANGKPSVVEVTY